MCGHWQALVLGATCAFMVLADRGDARAQPTDASLSGTWRAGATNIEVAVESWGEDCGPRPESSRSAGGGIVNIEQVSGQLVIHGRGQDIRSDGCWSRNPAMRRKSAAFAGNAWTTRCSTPANDPREEQGTYTLRIINADTLTYQDVSRYNWSLNRSRCVAKFTTVQTLTRGSTADAEDQAPGSALPQPAKSSGSRVAAESAPLPEPGDNDRNCVAGTPRRLSIRPRRAEIEVGQRICFRPRLADSADCPIANPVVTWSLKHSKALRGTLVNGCFTAASTAAEAEGEFTILASAAGLRADATVAVHPVDLSSLIAKRMGGAAPSAFDEPPPLEAAPQAVTRLATRRTTEGGGSSPRKVLGAALGIAATLLAVAALWLSRRKAPTWTPSLASTGRTSLDSIPPIDPGPVPVVRDEEAEARQAVPPPDARDPRTQAESAETQPVPVREAGPMGTPQPSAEEHWICPQCRVGYPAHQRTCPKDGAALMPYSQFAHARKPLDEHAKRCPRCGSTFPEDASFCSEDGTRLVAAAANAR